jgi:hypothetical protein
VASIEVVDDLGEDDGAATDAAADAEPEAEVPVLRDRRRRDRRAPPKPPAGGRLLRMFGLLCLFAGVVTTVLASQGALPATLPQYGVDPAVLLALGAVAFVIGVVRRQTALAQTQLAAMAQQQQGEQTDLQANVQWLVEQQHAHLERPPAKGEELERVLEVLHRQDEKLGNVSKALKMYGKPLMEIANQIADVSAQLAQLKGQVEALVGSLPAAFAQLEASARAEPVDLGPLEQQTGELAQDLRKTLTAFGEKLPSSQALQQLQQQLVRVEASVQATSQRLDDSEVRKSLVRLEDTSKAHGKKLEEVARQEALQSESQRLERQLDNSIGKVQAAVEQVRSKHLGGLENTVRDVQRELSSLATSVAYIQQAVKGGARVAAAPATPVAHAAPAAPAPTHTPPAAHAAPAAAPYHAEPVAHAAPAAAAAHAAPPAAAAAAAPATPIDTKGLNDAQAGVAQNKTGARAASGKNVLGAIAKLKKMKG